MITSNNSRRLRPIVLFCLILSLVGVMKSPTSARPRSLATPQASECESGLGGRIFANGGEVEVEILPSIAGFTSELNFISPGPARFIGTNRDPGTIVRLGTFPAGVELIFSIFVRETQRTFVTGPGSGNPDGLAHAEVTCFGKGRSNIGFEDQMGGGDRNFVDLICAVRQTGVCGYSISPQSQSFDAGGGRGSISVSAGSSCSWTASSSVNWIAITSGGAGSDGGTVNYSVAVNPDTGSRTGGVMVQGQTFTVFQDGNSASPLITSAVRSGKQLLVSGVNFDSDSVILLNGEQQKTIHDPNSLRTLLIGKKLGKWAQPGDRLRVRTSSGALSPEFTYNP
jgi:hypothetical protein